MRPAQQPVYRTSIFCDSVETPGTHADQGVLYRPLNIGPDINTERLRSSSVRIRTVEAWMSGDPADSRLLFCERVANLARHCGRVRRGDVRHRSHDDPPFADRHDGHELYAQQFAVEDDLDGRQFAVVATRRSSKRLE